MARPRNTSSEDIFMGGAAIFALVVTMVLVFYVVNPTPSQYKYEWKPELDGTERVMRELPSDQTEKRCGDYFVTREINGMQYSRPYTKLAYRLIKTPAELERFDDAKFFVGRGASINKFEIVIDDSKLVPTDQVFGADRGFDRIVIRISQADYDKSPCLKQVSLRHK